MTGHPYNDYYTVEWLSDEVVLVGEKHDSDRSAQLARNVLTTVNPGTVAIEMPPRGRGTGAGMAAGEQYARREDTPIVNIDEPRRWSDFDLRVSRLLTDANTFTKRPTPNGDLLPKVAHNARQLVYEKYGDDVYHAMYTEREVAMVERLRWLVEHAPTPIVAHVGAFHVEAMTERWESGAEQRQIVPTDRIRNNTDEIVRAPEAG